MELSVEEVIEGLFKDAHEYGPNVEKPRDDDIVLPPWFDRRKYNRGKRFVMDHAFSMFISIYFGSMSLLSIPTILRIFKSTGRSSTTYTAYRRYMATASHILSWFENELEPGTLAWRSIQYVRQRHYANNISSQKRGLGLISQRDMCLTAVAFTCYPLLKPATLGIAAVEEGDWEGFVHFWATISYLVGLEDRYNAFRPSLDDTIDVFNAIDERVFRSTLENVPEYYEQMSRALLEGLSVVNPLAGENVIFYTKCLSGVPGYVYDEEKRRELQRNIRQQLRKENKELHEGVNVQSLKPPSAIPDLPDIPPRYINFKDFDTLDKVPAFRELSRTQRVKLFIMEIMFMFVRTYVGRIIINRLFLSLYFIARFYPVFAMLKFGYKKAFMNMFGVTPASKKIVMTNKEFYACPSAIKEALS